MRFPRKPPNYHGYRNNLNKIGYTDIPYCLECVIQYTVCMKFPVKRLKHLLWRKSPNTSAEFIIEGEMHAYNILISKALNLFVKAFWILNDFYYHIFNAVRAGKFNKCAPKCVYAKSFKVLRYTKRYKACCLTILTCPFPAWKKIPRVRCQIISQHWIHHHYSLPDLKQFLFSWWWGLIQS